MIRPRWLSMMLKFNACDRPSYNFSEKSYSRALSGIQIIGAHDGGVAAGIAAADPAALDHGHIGDTVIFRQIIGAWRDHARPRRR